MREINMEEEENKELDITQLRVKVKESPLISTVG